MAIYFTSDNHFNHDNIIRFCNRPFEDTSHMNEEMILRWNSRVQPEDTVYFLGDFAFGDKSQIPIILGRLNGSKHLIYGNHDDLKHHPLGSVFDLKANNANWKSIQEQLFVEIDGKIVWMAHIPFGHLNDKRGYRRPEPTQSTYDVILCGHVHQRWVKNTAGSINVGCDNFDFYPVTLTELLDRAEKEVAFDSSVFLPV